MISGENACLLWSSLGFDPVFHLQLYEIFIASNLFIIRSDLKIILKDASEKEEWKIKVSYTGF